jgi:hypothetical protein
MNRVMDMLELTSESIAERRLSLLYAAAEQQPQEADTGGLPRPRSSAARSMKLLSPLQQTRGCYLPELAVAMVEEELLLAYSQQLEQQQRQQQRLPEDQQLDSELQQRIVAEAKEAAKQALASLRANQDAAAVQRWVTEVLSERKCDLHKCQLQLRASTARLTDRGSITCGHQVFTLCCTHSSDPCYSFYDGSADDLLNLNSTELFSHQLLRELLERMVRSGVTFHSEWQVMRQLQDELPPELQQRAVSMPLFVEAFFAYVLLLEEDLPAWTCPICRDTPMALVGDATGYKVFDHHLQHKTSFGQPTAGMCPGVQVRRAWKVAWCAASQGMSVTTDTAGTS